MNAKRQEIEWNTHYIFIIIGSMCKETCIALLSFEHKPVPNHIVSLWLDQEIVSPPLDVSCALSQQRYIIYLLDNLHSHHKWLTNETKNKK